MKRHKLIWQFKYYNENKAYFIILSLNLFVPHANDLNNVLIGNKQWYLVLLTQGDTALKCLKYFACVS